jgi:hypothetical protein
MRCAVSTEYDARSHLTEEMTERYSSVAQVEVEPPSARSSRSPATAISCGSRHPKTEVVGKWWESPIRRWTTAPHQIHKPSQLLSFSGAGYRVRTDDIQLGKRGRGQPSGYRRFATLRNHYICGRWSGPALTYRRTQFQAICYTRVTS